MTSLEQDLLRVNTENPQESFPEIAKKLMCNYIIRRGNSRYAIVEIEFYFYSPSHPDFITYPRKMEAGRWFFHQSGVDLTFKTEGEPIKIKDSKEKTIWVYKDCSFGGILIRGLFNLDNKDSVEAERYIWGPQKCVNTLWDNFNAFEIISKEYPVIVEASKEEKILLNQPLVPYKRHIKIGEAKRLSKVKEWVERLGFKVNGDKISKELEEDIVIYAKNLFDNECITYPYRFFNVIEGEKTWKEMKHLTAKEKDRLVK